MRRPTDTIRGRPPRFKSEDLLRVGATLRALLARETSIGVRNFVGQYLSILDFQRDVRDTLRRGNVNLFEAQHLSRLTAKPLDCTGSEARTYRPKVLDALLLP